MGVVYRKTLTVSAASATGVAAAQTVGVGGGNLTLTSSTVTLPNTGQRPELVSVADLSGVNVTLYGTTYHGRTITYTTVGPNGTLVIPWTFYTITRIAVSATTGANTISAGWAAQADLPMIPADYRYNPSDISFSCVISSGSPTYTARFTMDDPQDSTLDATSFKWFDHPIVASQTADNTGNYGKPITASSLYVNGASTMKYVSIQGVGAI